MGEDYNQSLTTHAKKGKTEKEQHSHNKPRRPQNRDYSYFICFTCDECSGYFSPATCKSTYLRSTRSKGRVDGAREKLNLDLQGNNN